MLRRVLVFLALWCGPAATAFADPLDELLKSFTIGGKPVPPEIFADFGDAMMSDSRPIGVPEPSTWAMLVLGFAGLGYAGFRRAAKVPAAFA
jgi:PEP-CTERM motif